MSGLFPIHDPRALPRADSNWVKAEPVLRRACDRCHAQKLSCQRHDDGPCVRCVRASATCASSPSMRNRRGRPLARQLNSALAVPRPDSGIGSSHATPSEAPATSSEAADNLHQAMHDMPDASSERHSYQFFDGVETTSWIDGATRQGHGNTSGSFIGLGHEPSSHASDSSSINWVSAFSTADFRQSSIQRAASAMGGDNVCIFQRLVAETPMTTPANRGDDDMLQSHEHQSASGSVRSVDSSHTSGTFTGYASPAVPTSQGQEQSPGKADGEWLQKLAEINIKLFNHANQNPNQDLPLNKGSDNSGQPATINEFDRTIVLSVHFLKALRKLHGTSSRDLPMHTAAATPPALDAGTALIIYSCYIRVTELFIDRLRAIQGAFSAATAAASQSNRSAVPPLCLPTITAMTCSLDDFPVLQLRMALELVEETLDVMGALLVGIMSVAACSRGDGVWDY
ncbi:hypothetical protein B0T26DRAFT_747292 [Lasiosphaeria miniovina]|uniref:Zn(2)-C6 fungal-type domain-containing protein n=1 Tax=Lasiosphaeria miniovina TaxID=1954250 RepID=A0AA40B3D7_9PEZI|nr:uncharacterized protein B0T26DRAFT_747292 [Lasiosphaeria miniovina]KAK0726901.1 hypothetical protein B0T26DRAFT_747292 [Lasiosphaeria miniovina]